MSEDNVYFDLFRIRPGKGDLRRLEIIHAALSGLAKEGYAGSSFDRIAKTLKTRRSHIAYYFTDREELLEHMARYITAVAQECTQECLKAADTPEEKVLAIAEGAYLWASRFPEQARVMLLFYFLSTHSKAFRKLNSEIREAGFLRMKALLRECVVIPPARLEETAKGFQNLLTGLLVERAIVDNSQDRDYLAITKGVWKTWLRAFPPARKRR